MIKKISTSYGKRAVDGGTAVFKKLSAKILAAVLMFMMMSADSLAQTRIRFATGKRSATVSGRLPANSSKPFIVNARAGQVLTVKVSSSNGKVTVFVNNPGEDEGADRTNEWSGTLSSNGDTAFSIDNGGKATKFTLTITLR